MSKQDRPIGMYGDTRTSGGSNEYAMLETLKKIEKNTGVIRSWVTVLGVIMVLAVVGLFVL